MPALLTTMSRRAEALLRAASTIASTSAALRDVGAQRRTAAAPSARGDRARAVAVAVGDDHLRALGDELARDALAEARRRAGDDRDLAFESHVVVSSIRCQPWWIATVFSVEKPYSASKPFSRPWPECLTPPNGSSTPPPAP